MSYAGKSEHFKLLTCHTHRTTRTFKQLIGHRFTPHTPHSASAYHCDTPYPARAVAAGAQSASIHPGWNFDCGWFQGVGFRV